MAEITAIEWSDSTFNPWTGCTKISPACDNCYAEALMDTRYGRVRWGAGEDRSRTAPSNWKQPLRWDRDAEAMCTRPFVFCASLADVFDNEVDPRWRADLFALIRATPNLVWLLLTKRIGNVLHMTDVERLGSDFALPSNVAIGATMANQNEYSRDAHKLAGLKLCRDILFTFGSFEPLLGPVILDSYAPDWVIVGGESGTNPRHMNLDWARLLLQSSASYRRIFNFKQVGGKGADKGGHELDGRTHFDRPDLPSPRRKAALVGEGDRG